ncbi:hypothetical protein [Kitasatospora sp. NPDC094016]|uniref:hypothetical protein n=1 Tax=Kitasatospora sp. NPDC094016 TaxID=3154986 RepID=UPI003319B511
MSEAPFTYTINNLAYDELRPKSEKATLGLWDPSPQTIPGRTRSDEIKVTPKGRSPYVKGLVVYQVDSDESAWVKIGWDIPGHGSINIVNVETSHPEIIAALDGYDGRQDTESITVTVVDARSTKSGGNG